MLQDGAKQRHVKVSEFKRNTFYVAVVDLRRTAERVMAIPVAALHAVEEVLPLTLGFRTVAHVNRIPERQKLLTGGMIEIERDDLGAAPFGFPREKAAGGPALHGHTVYSGAGT